MLNCAGCGGGITFQTDIQRELFGSPVAITRLPLTVQGNRVTAWRPKGINIFGVGECTRLAPGFAGPLRTEVSAALLER
jgi:hypothetical protein